MTKAELDAIPEMGGFGYRDNGDGTRTPFMQPRLALFQPKDEPFIVVDSEGQTWTLGYANGQRWKVRGI